MATHSWTKHQLKAEPVRSRKMVARIRSTLEVPDSRSRIVRRKRRLVTQHRWIMGLWISRACFLARLKEGWTGFFIRYLLLAAILPLLLVNEKKSCVTDGLMQCIFL